MNNITLNPTQHAVLAHAIHHTEGRIDWFPENIKGGARQKVLLGLFNRALITPHGSDYCVAAEGYDALGCARPAVGMLVPDPGLDAAVAQSEASLVQDLTNALVPAEQPVAKAIRTREHSKQATIINMLQRAEGATITQICEATGWQPHTVRGTFAAALKKKLGMTICSDKQQGGERIYRATV